MTIASKLNLLRQDVADARNAITSMGGTVTENGGTSQLAEDIQTIPISVGVLREISEDGTFQIPQTPFSFSLPEDATKLGENSLRYGFYKASNLTETDLSSLVQITEDNAMSYGFYQCTGLTKANLSGLAMIDSAEAMNYAFEGCIRLATLNLRALAIVKGQAAMYRAFYNCSKLTEINLPWLVYVGTYEDNSPQIEMAYCFVGCSQLETLNLGRLKSLGYSSMLYGFQNCTNLESVDIHSLEKIGRSGLSNAFMGCTSLESVSFNSLNEMRQNALTQTFRGCTNLKHLYFHSLTMESFTENNTMVQMLMGVTGCTVHLPSVLDNATFKAYNFVRNGFSGTNTTILYDL